MPLCWLFRRETCVAFVLLVLGLGGLGCNVFDGLGPSPTSVEDLLADARVAMTNENPQHAVRLLETAFETDSTNVEVRIELANALYAARDVDLFTVRSTVEHLNGKGAAEAATGDSDEELCTEGANSPRSPGRFLAISVEDHEGLQILSDARDRIRRVSRLVVDGVLRRRPEAFAEGPVEVRSKGFLLAALTRLSRRLLGVRDVLRATEGTLYVDQESDPPGALVACGPTTEDRNQVERSLCRHKAGVLQGAFWLERRNELLNSEQTSLLLDLLETHREALRTQLSCPASSNTDAESAGLQRAPVE